MGKKASPSDLTLRERGWGRGGRGSARVWLESHQTWPPSARWETIPWTQDRQGTKGDKSHPCDHTCHGQDHLLSYSSSRLGQLAPFYRCGPRSTERLSDWPKVTQLDTGGQRRLVTYAWSVPCLFEFPKALGPLSTRCHNQVGVRLFCRCLLSQSAVSGPGILTRANAPASGSLPSGLETGQCPAQPLSSWEPPVRPCCGRAAGPLALAPWLTNLGHADSQLSWEFRQARGRGTLGEATVDVCRQKPEPV